MIGLPQHKGSKVPYSIDKGVKMPSDAVKRTPKYPFHEMNVGDSFVASACLTDRLRTAMSAWGKKLGRKFILRKIGEQVVRVWRVE
jgi:hypothetical protein